MEDEMGRRAIHAPRQPSDAIISDARGNGQTTTRISFSASSSGLASATISADSALTTYTSYSTTTFVSAGTTYKQSQGFPVVVSNSAEFASLSAAGAFNTAASSSTAPSTATATRTPSATSSATSAHKSSSSNTSTLIPAIVVPVVVVLLASFAAFFFLMRRRHHRALEKEARFEKVKPSPSRSSPPDNSSRRNLIPAGAAYGQSGGEKLRQSSNVQAKAVPAGQATGPPRPRRPEEREIPSSAIGIARSTSSASAVYTKPAPRPPRSAHEMRGLPSNPRPEKRAPRSHVLSGGDIIDSYAAMRPSTAPNGTARSFSPSTVTRTPLPIKPMGRPPPKNTTPLPPQYNAMSPAAHHSPALSHTQTNTPDNNYGLTEENMRIAPLVHGSTSARQTPDNASISDIDEHDHAQTGRDDKSDISDLDEEQERMASGLNTPMGTGRGTPMSGRDYVR